MQPLVITMFDGGTLDNILDLAILLVFFIGASYLLELLFHGGKR